MITVKKNIYIDLDGVVFDTVSTIIKLYNEDFKYYDGFVEVDSDEINTWGFEELTLASREYINEYFNQPRFFKNIKLFDGAISTISALSKIYNIIFISMGYSPNLKLKEKWIEENIPWSEFIGINFEEYKDKSHIDMSESIFIDDSVSNLLTSNAGRKICFGEVKSWNQDWSGKRIRSWESVKKEILEEERYDGV